MAADAEALYAAFRSAVSVDDDGSLLPPQLDGIADGGRGWFAIANAIEQVAAPAADVIEPYDYDLLEIPPRIASDGQPVQESEDERPTKITIRQLTAADLCAPHYGTDRFQGSIFARAMGIDLDTVEWRMDPSDYEAGFRLCLEAAGLDAAELCKRAYFDGGGKQLLHDAPDVAWTAVAGELLTTIDGDVVRVRCRTPGIGTLTMGPLRYGHLRTYRGAAARDTEWHGRIVAIAKASDRSVGAINALRIDDAIVAWDAFETLKKKVEARATSRVVAVLSSRSSAGGHQNTSTT